jgi:hypothetical protein
MNYEGKTYEALSGQWSWSIEQDGVRIAGGAGYECMEEAEGEMQAELAVLVT